MTWVWGASRGRGEWKGGAGWIGHLAESTACEAQSKSSVGLASSVGVRKSVRGKRASAAEGTAGGDAALSL